MANILIIDDSHPTLALIQNYVATEGHSATTTCLAREGLKLLAASRFDLIVTDIYMPECDGFELIREIRRQGTSVPILAVSSNVEDGNCFKAARFLGASSTLPKPFSREQLVAAIDALLPLKRRSA